MSTLTKEFVAERDSRVFQMRKSGVSIQEIGRRVGMSTPAVVTSIERTLKKLSGEALMAYPQVLQMELERLDSLLSAAWPLTQHRKVKLSDGSEVVVEPDVKFMQQARELIKDRIKLLGLETTTVQVIGAEPVRHTIPSVVEATVVDRHNPEAEARQLYEIMQKSGILPDQLAIGASSDSTRDTEEVEQLLDEVDG